MSRRWIAREAKLNDAMFARLYRYEALQEQRNRCAYCAEPTKFAKSTADHVTPRIRGGATTRENIKAACSPCNLAKGSRSVEEFNAILTAEIPPRIGVFSSRLLMAWARARIWRRQLTAECRILAAVGIVA